ncbi:MAG TPA: hypothetical protein VFA26_02415 [Gemmataceae bacterium]|nr:hypothetical protein [Gemmataceae bacterium]
MSKPRGNLSKSEAVRDRLPPAGQPAAPDAPPPAFHEGPLTRLGQAWSRFWFRPADPVGLHAVRMLAGTLFLCWLLAYAGHVQELFGLNGWFDAEAYAEAHRLAAQERAAGESAVPQAGWSLLFAVGHSPAALTAVYWLSVVVVALFTLGLWARLTGVLTWLVVGSFTVNPALGSDADALLIVLAFYLMVGYLFLGQWRRGRRLPYRIFGSTEALLLGRRDDGAGPPPSMAANAALRLLQVHFAIILVTTGLHKLQFGEWWGGLALWFPLYPPLETTLEQAREHAGNASLFLALLSIATYAVLAWEIGFPAFAWRRGWWRLVLIGGALIGWLGASLLYRVPGFGPALLIGCLSYLTDDEWRAVTGLLPRLPGLSALARWLPAVPDEEPVKVGSR